MLFIILPSYNEEKALPTLLKNTEKACSGLPYRIIVVDDGSGDHTPGIAREYAAASERVEIVSHGENLGLGQALLSGFKHVLDEKFAVFAPETGLAAGDVLSVKIPADPWPDTVVTLDADNTHPPELIPLLYARIREGNDLVVASRYAPGGRQRGLSPLRRFLSRTAGGVMQLFFPIRGIQDYSCGYRAYRLSILREGISVYGDALIESRNFAAMVELLLKLAPLCRRLSEIPLDLRYDRKQGASKMKIGATILGYVALIIHFKRADWDAPEWPEEWVEE